MHKEDLIKKLAKKNRRTRQFYRDALHEMLEGIQSQLAEGKTVTPMGFGTFFIRTHRGGKGMNFKTKKPME